MDSSVRFVVVCYGSNLGYAHGAKYQILRAFHDRFFNLDSKISVVTDQPQLFSGYPVDVLTIDESTKERWSFGNQYHFGIKNRALAAVMDSTEESVFLQLDTDTFWTGSPMRLTERINPQSAVLKFNEGPIIDSRNRSIHRFHEALLGRTLNFGDRTYQLDSSAQMWNSGIIGLHRESRSVLDDAYEFMRVIHSEVKAHTVEQFVLGEVLRLDSFTIETGRRSLGDWSSIGRKDYFTPKLATFFKNLGENDFVSHLSNVHELSPRRPLSVFLKQKVQRLIR